MSNAPYLWDKSGPVDPFVAKLERCLQGKRRIVKAAGRRRGPRLLRAAALLTAAAALVVWVYLSSDRAGADAPVLPVAADLPTPASPNTGDPQAAVEATDLPAKAAADSPARALDAGPQTTPQAK